MAVCQRSPEKLADEGKGAMQAAASYRRTEENLPDSWVAVTATLPVLLSGGLSVPTAIVWGGRQVTSRMQRFSLPHFPS